MKQSAGILFFRRSNHKINFLLVHPGGPFWVRKDAGAWSIPKGEPAEGEEKLKAAWREVQEELGLMDPMPAGDLFIELQPVKQKSGKMIYAWALEKDIDVSTVHSNEFEMEWPRGSGKMKKFPEIDRAAWFDEEEVMVRVIPAQQALIEDLLRNIR